MKDTMIKKLHLIDELTSASKLIEIGFGELQNLDTTNDFLFIPLQLISSGLERLMKCHICLGHLEKNGKYPDSKFLKDCGGKNGHDLLDLKNFILEQYFNPFEIPALIDDQNFLANDKNLEKVIYLLSEFGKYARYHNLDVVTESTKPSIDVVNEWKDFEIKILKANPDMFARIGDIASSKEIVNFVNSEIVFLLEKFTRAITRQFTLGKLGKKADQLSPILFSWIILKDSDLGKKDYRKNSVEFKNKNLSVHIRTLKDEEERKNNNEYKSKKISKDDFKDEWPFYAETVIIECREKHWCVVTIDNKDYALNGAASGRYKLEHVHDAGMAILGKSVYPVLKLALSLT